MSDEIQRSEKFAGEIELLYGDDLVSVVLYGSAARGEYRPGVSDLNILVLLKGINPPTLRRGSPLARKWVKGGNQTPLMFGEAEWRGSADVFPIEYSDMRDAHRVLFGIDPFEGMEIDNEHLRLQSEHELRAKLIQLREHYVLSAEKPKELGQLLISALPTFLTLFRTLLRLMGRAVPRESGEVIDAVAAEIGFEPGPFQRVMEARDRKARFAPTADEPVVIGYLTGVSRASEWLDRHDSSAQTP